jgi:hypothetical protein
LTPMTSRLIQPLVYPTMSKMLCGRRCCSVACGRTTDPTKMVHSMDSSFSYCCIVCVPFANMQPGPIFVHRPYCSFRIHLLPFLSQHNLSPLTSSSWLLPTIMCSCWSVVCTLQTGFEIQSPFRTIGDSSPLLYIPIAFTFRFCRNNGMSIRLRRRIQKDKY